MAPSLGKMPTVGASLDLAMEAFERVCRMQLGAVRDREGHVGENVVLGLVHEGGEFRRLGPELVGDLAPLGGGAVRILLGEGGSDEGRDDAPALLAGMGQQVAHEVDAAALPCGAEDAGRGSLEPFVIIGDRPA